MKKFLFLFLFLFLSLAFLPACNIGSSGGGGSTADDPVNPDDPDDPVDPVEPPAEKFYTINPLEDAQFYYNTSSKTIYAYKDGVLKIIHLTMTITQEGENDVIQNIIPDDFYKLGYYLDFELTINGEKKYYEQLYGEIHEVTELRRRPDCMRMHMNNGRFSITDNTWDIYDVSDIRNLTVGSGIARTLKCTAYYLGAYTQMESSYGLWFSTVDDMGNYKSALYYWPETENSPQKIIDELGEMWAF